MATYSRANEQAKLWIKIVPSTLQMSELAKTFKSEAKKSWPWFALSILLEFLKKLFEHRFLATANDFIDLHSAPVLNIVRPLFIWFVHTPFVLLVPTVCVISLHAYFTSHHELDSVESQKEPIEEKVPESIPVPPSHNIVFLRGERYNPDRHGLYGDGLNCDKVRIILAGFQNRNIVGSTVTRLPYVRSAISYRDCSGTEILYVSPTEWLKHNEDRVDLECGGEPEFVVVAFYNYLDKRWNTRKVIHTSTWQGDLYLDEVRPLPFGMITAEVSLIQQNGNTPTSGSVTFDLKENGEFTIL